MNGDSEGLSVVDYLGLAKESLSNLSEMLQNRFSLPTTFSIKGLVQMDRDSLADCFVGRAVQFRLIHDRRGRGPELNVYVELADVMTLGGMKLQLPESRLQEYRSLLTLSRDDRESVETVGDWLRQGFQVAQESGLIVPLKGEMSQVVDIGDVTGVIKDDDLIVVEAEISLRSFPSGFVFVSIAERSTRRARSAPLPNSKGRPAPTIVREVEKDADKSNARGRAKSLGTVSCIAVFELDDFHRDIVIEEARSKELSCVIIDSPKRLFQVVEQESVDILYVAWPEGVPMAANMFASIKKAKKGQPLSVVAALVKPTKSAVINALKAGADSVIGKPFTSEEWRVRMSQELSTSVIGRV